MPSVFDRLQRYWWSSVDAEGLDIHLTAVDQTNALGECPIHVAAWKGEGLSVGFTNGCFDILHAGHIGLLNAAPDAALAPAAAPPSEDDAT